jgi:CRP/FNR family transcriptional regulator, cyclic AMP receptor protein
VLSAEDLAALTARGIHRSFPRGQALFHVGQVPDRVLLLRKGRVKVETTTSAGRSVVLAVRGPGELVGGRSSAARPPRPRPPEQFLRRVRLYRRARRRICGY